MLDKHWCIIIEQSNLKEETCPFYCFALAQSTENININPNCFILKSMGFFDFCHSLFFEYYKLNNVCLLFALRNKAGIRHSFSAESDIFLLRKEGKK